MYILSSKIGRKGKKIISVISASFRCREKKWKSQAKWYRKILYRWSVCDGFSLQNNLTELLNDKDCEGTICDCVYFPKASHTIESPDNVKLKIKHMHHWNWTKAESKFSINFSKYETGAGTTVIDSGFIERSISFRGGIILKPTTRWDANWEITGLDWSPNDVVLRARIDEVWLTESWKEEVIVWQYFLQSPDMGLIRVVSLVTSVHLIGSTQVDEAVCIFPKFAVLELRVST